MNALLLPAAAAGATTLLLMPVARHLAIQRGYLDVPNRRSSHSRPTPRAGGYAMLAGVMVGVWMAGAWRDGAVAAIVWGALLLAGVALVDDRRALPRVFRLILQITIAGLVVWGIGYAGVTAPPASLTQRWITGIVGLVWIVGLINTYNFMDGLNGIAGIAALVTGATLAVLALSRGDLPIAVLAAATAATAAGFLPFNLPNGSMFMGDAGSTTLGLIFGAVVFQTRGPGVVPVSAALPLAPFVLDAGATILRRALRGERFFATPHRSHYYQRLQQQGWSHAGVASLYGGMTAASAAVALAFDRLGPGQQAAAVAAILLGHAAIFACIQAGWSAQARSQAAGSPIRRQVSG